MINLYDAIEEFKERDPVLYLALMKFASAAEEHERRIQEAEKAILAIQDYCTTFCIAYANSAQAITAAAGGGSGWNLINLNAEYFDGDNLHDNVTNNSQIRIKRAGLYLVFAQANIVPSGTPATDRPSIRIDINPTSLDVILRGTYVFGHGNVAVGIRPIQANATVEMYVHTNFDTNTVSSSFTRPTLGAYRLFYDPRSEFTGAPF